MEVVKKDNDKSKIEVGDLVVCGTMGDRYRLVIEDVCSTEVYVVALDGYVQATYPSIEALRLESESASSTYKLVVKNKDIQLLI